MITSVSQLALDVITASRSGVAGWFVVGRGGNPNS